MYRVTIHKNRPDFRVFIDLLYGFGRNIDTDGDSYLVNSRTWTSLYIQDRESNDPCIDINISRDFPDVFEVESKSRELETLAAIYLFAYCGISIEIDEQKLDTAEIKKLKEVHASNLLRAENSIWHQSSDQNPYPNIRN